MRTEPPAPVAKSESSTPPLPPQQQILQLAREIEQLAATPQPPQQFFPMFLGRLVAAVGAPAGAVWLVDRGQFRLFCAVRLKEIGYDTLAESHPVHQRLLSDVASMGQTKTIHTDDEPRLGLPNRQLLVLAALQVGGRCAGVVEIFQRPDVAPAARAGYLQFVEQMCGYACGYLERGQTQQAAPVAATTFSEELARLGLQLQGSLQVREVAAVAANEGRLLLGCDRVSVVLRRGRKVTVHAVSGQESVHARSNLIRAMVKLSEEVIRSGEPLRYAGEMESLPPQVEERLADFVQEGGARMVLAVPLREPVSIVAPGKQNEEHRPKPGPVFGCLVLEQFSQSRPSPQLAERLDWLTTYGAASLNNARTHQSIFLLPVWQTLGKASDWIHGRRLVKLLTGLAIAAAVICAFVFVRLDFRVEGDGRLMPVQRREVFVPYDGEVIDVLVASGDRVSAGDLLVKLRNNELRAELISTHSQAEEKQKLLGALTAERDDALKGPSGEREIRIEGELAKTRAELQGLELQLRVLEEREKLLDVRAPAAGVVSTFEVDRLLKHRPVRRGEILLEVMDDAGPWQLELDVAEHRMGHLLKAQQSEKQALPVEYLLVTSPERTYHATLQEVATRAAISDDNTPVVQVIAALGDEELQRRIGAEVRAKVHCGRASLGYVLFGDVIEFIQKYLWL